MTTDTSSRKNYAAVRLLGKSLFVLFGSTMEAAAGMLIHSTALRPITTRPNVHAVSVGVVRPMS